jgi:hypothetical protein
MKNKFRIVTNVEVFSKKSNKMVNIGPLFAVLDEKDNVVGDKLYRCYSKAYNSFPYHAEK